MRRAKKTPKWLKWEFWPFWFFYTPVYALIAVHAIRSRTLSYFTLANPGMKMGGFASYSKYEILRQLSPEYLPKSFLLKENSTVADVLNGMKSNAISFPVILKPDEGERGWKVEKIQDEKGIQSYLADFPGVLLIQEFIDLPEEYGVMYYRFPGKKTGHVSSLMQREFLSITGDGSSGLLQLFQQSPRCSYHMDRLLQKFSSQLNMVLKNGETKILEEIGNHNRGTIFLDFNQKISGMLVDTFDRASSTLHEWYFGRFDVRTKSFEAMENGDFKVVEVNGVNSEPAHIYDPQMPLFRAYRDLFRHWNIIFKISRENRKRGFKAEKTLSTYRLIRRHLKAKKEFPNKIHTQGFEDLFEKFQVFF